MPNGQQEITVWVAGRVTEITQEGHLRWQPMGLFDSEKSARTKGATSRDFAVPMTYTLTLTSPDEMIICPMCGAVSLRKTKRGGTREKWYSDACRNSNSYRTRKNVSGSYYNRRAEQQKKERAEARAANNAQ